MSRIEQIEDQIRELTHDELSALRSWFWNLTLSYGIGRSKLMQEMESSIH